MTSVNLARAQESLKAADLCLREGFVNSAASRAYYAIFQAAQVALEISGVTRTEWSHPGLQAVSLPSSFIVAKFTLPRFGINFHPAWLCGRPPTTGAAESAEK